MPRTMIGISEKMLLWAIGESGISDTLVPLPPPWPDEEGRALEPCVPVPQPAKIRRVRQTAKIRGMVNMLSPFES